MCGRFAQSDHPLGVAPFAVIAAAMRGDELPDRYNICPTQDALVVRHDAEEGGLRADSLRWGLVPAWAKDVQAGSRMINARSETASSKPSFRGPFRARRCVIPATGFFEWSRGNGAKQPHFIRQAQEQTLLFAGLWDSVRLDGQTIETFTILTRAANEFMRPLHDRMPVILCADDARAWMEPCDEVELLEGLLGAEPTTVLAAYEVSNYVNSPRNSGKECIAPAPKGLFED